MEISANKCATDFISLTPENFDFGLLLTTGQIQPIHILYAYRARIALSNELLAKQIGEMVAELYLKKWRNWRIFATPENLLITHRWTNRSGSFLACIQSTQSSTQWAIGQANQISGRRVITKKLTKLAHFWDSGKLTILLITHKWKNRSGWFLACIWSNKSAIECTISRFNRKK